MANQKLPPIKMTEAQTQYLEYLVRCHNTPQSLSKRIQIILLAQDGYSNAAISRKLQMERNPVSLWRKRWVQAFPSLLKAEKKAQLSKKEYLKMIENIFRDAPRSGTPPKYTAEQVAQILAIACEDPQKSNRPISHWTSYSLADEAMKRGIVQNLPSRTVRDFLKSSQAKTSSLSFLAKSRI